MFKFCFNKNFLKNVNLRKYKSTLKKTSKDNFETTDEIYVMNQVFKPTHTHQAFASNDIRNLRFLNRIKLVDDDFAIDDIKKVDVIDVDGDKVWCDGGELQLGHPKVFIKLGKDHKIETCGYCGLRFRNSKF